MTVLKTRATDSAEIMDDSLCDASVLCNTYRDFDRVNHLVSGWRGLYTRYLRPVLRAAGPGASLLDIGCGGGDVLRRLAGYARRDGLTSCFVGADTDDRAIAYARSLPQPPNVRFACAPARQLADAGERFDIVISNHLLHHLSDAEVVTLCETSGELASRLVLHADIHRHPLAYAGFPLIGGWFRDSLILPDGLISIRRAFTPGELARLAPRGWHVRVTFPFRLQLIWET